MNAAVDRRGLPAVHHEGMSRNTTTTANVVDLLGPDSELHEAAAYYGLAHAYAEHARVLREREPNAVAMSASLREIWTYDALGNDGPVHHDVMTPDVPEHLMDRYLDEHAVSMPNGGRKIELDEAERAEDAALIELQRLGSDLLAPTPEPALSRSDLQTLMQVASLGRKVLHARLAQDGWDQGRIQQVQAEAHALMARLDHAQHAVGVYLGSQAMMDAADRAAH